MATKWIVQCGPGVTKHNLREIKRFVSRKYGRSFGRLSVTRSVTGFDISLDRFNSNIRAHVPVFALRQG